MLQACNYKLAVNWLIQRWKWRYAGSTPAGPKPKLWIRK